MSNDQDHLLKPRINIPTVIFDKEFFGYVPIKPNSLVVKGYFVYRLISEDNETIYVGVTKHLRGRIMSHWRTNGDSFVFFRAKRYASKDEAYFEENRLIQELKPVLNKFFNFDELNYAKEEK